MRIDIIFGMIAVCGITSGIILTNFDQYLIGFVVSISSMIVFVSSFFVFPFDLRNMGNTVEGNEK